MINKITITRLITVLLILTFTLSWTVKSDVSLALANQKVTICHNPGPNEVTIEVSASAVDAHAAHGDTIGQPCDTYFAQCTDGWTTSHSDTYATYYLEVDRDILGGHATHIVTVDRVDESISVIVTSLTSGNIWSFTEPSCGTACGYLLGWYGGTTHGIGEGAGTYKIEISQDHEGLIALSCVD